MKLSCLQAACNRTVVWSRVIPRVPINKGVPWHGTCGSVIIRRSTE